MLPQNHTESDGAENVVEVLHSPKPTIRLPSSVSDISTLEVTSIPTSQRPNIEQSRNSQPRSPTYSGLSNGGNSSRDIILQSFRPRISVYTSADTEELIRLKGVYGGLCGLLKPFGEVVQGRVVIRDSTGASKSWNDFGVHFMKLNEERLYGPKSGLQPNTPSEIQNKSQGGQERAGLHGSVTERSGAYTYLLDTIINGEVDRAEKIQARNGDNSDAHASHQEVVYYGSPRYYDHFLRNVLSGRPMVAHESFTHPVACLIAISSQNGSPIETLRDLYNETRQGSRLLPSSAEGEFLRYYVLVHDEDHDDIAKSTSLFNQMKRHFGLHCHLLRLRSILCGATDDDGVKLPTCKWLSVEEEVSDIRQEGSLEPNEYQQYLYDTDITAIRTFIREMVTQSIIPFMENRVTSWNDQIASRRRGISGRFMSLSKRWGGFSTGRGYKSSSNIQGGFGTNYNPTTESYASDSPEAAMHRLADYAFMLRDWKLASSIYDILRGDFGDDKAWNHYANANEMMAVGLLLSYEPVIAKLKFDTIDQIIDTATYSYITRCRYPHGAVRCLVLATELYRSGGGISISEAAKWVDRLLELMIISPLVQSLMVDRIALCYKSQPGVGQDRWGSRDRKAALWSFLGSITWNALRKPFSASACLGDASHAYGLTNESPKLLPFLGMQRYWLQLEEDIGIQMQESGLAVGSHDLDVERATVDEENNTFDSLAAAQRNTRFSVSGGLSRPENVDLFRQLNNTTEQENDGFV